MPIQILTILSDLTKGTVENDEITSLGGDDIVSGEEGHDLIDGGEGNDTLYGDKGEGTGTGADATPIVLDINNLESQTFSGSQAGVGDSAVYRNVATLADGTSVWGRLVLVAKSDPNMTVDLADGSGSEILLNGHGQGDSADFRLEFFDPVTGEPVSLNSVATFNDIDRSHNGDTEAVSFEKDSFTGIGTSDDTSLDVTIGATDITASGTENNTATDEDGWISAEFEDRSFIEFTLHPRDTDSGFTFSGDLIADGFVVPIEHGNDTLIGGLGDDVIYGQGGDDVIDGGADNDSLIGGAGDDTMYGGADNDHLEGGAGHDLMLGESGSDYMDGGGGNDDISGGSGADTILGGAGDDTLSGGDGDDLIHGGDGDDVMTTGTGNDTLYGGAGNDTLSNSSGDDSLDGGTGDDSITATEGDDTLRGGGGRDTMSGGADNDELEGGTGDDRMTGGQGDDRFIYNAGDGHDTITDFNVGTTGTISDGDNTNNDYIDLTAFYDNLAELYADQADDGILNQSNLTDSKGRTVDYSDNSSFGPDGSLTFTDGTGDSSYFTSENTGVVCFAEGTTILTPQGPIPVEKLRPGDLVATRDDGPRRLIWTGKQSLGRQALCDNPRLRPIQVAADFTGGDAPLIVSPQHGLLVHLGGEERLARATHLADLGGGKVRVMAGCRQVSYFHLMFERHQVIFANGAPTESFYPGPQAIGALDSVSRTLIAMLFPGLLTGEVAATYGPPARSYLGRGDLPAHLDQLSRRRVPA